MGVLAVFFFLHISPFYQEEEEEDDEKEGEEGEKGEEDAVAANQYRQYVIQQPLKVGVNRFWNFNVHYTPWYLRC